MKSITLKFLYIITFYGEQSVSQKTLVDLFELLLKRKRSWSIDTKLKFVVGNTELGILQVTGKIEYAPSKEEAGAASTQS